MKRIVIAILILTTFAAEGKKSNSDWKDGVLKRVTKDHLTGESGQLGKKPPKHGVYISYYFVEADNQLYEGDDVRLKNNEKGFPVSVNGPVKFYVSGTDMYLRDDKGKQHKLRLVNVLPTNASPTQAAVKQK